MSAERSRAFVVSCAVLVSFAAGWITRTVPISSPAQNDAIFKQLSAILYALERPQSESTPVDSLIERHMLPSPAVRSEVPPAQESVQKDVASLTESVHGIAEKVEELTAALTARGLIEQPPSFTAPKNLSSLELVAQKLESDKSLVLMDHFGVSPAKLYGTYGTPDNLAASGGMSWWEYRLPEGTSLRFHFSNGAVADIENN